ncbi:DEAD/DEAH box helicase [Kaustia mangrovi]|uniref:DEAD/DEAH box helicase n=1 Tax=Kaustia mangrovi TaxID=2593653 RepID=A0A7S8C3L4_9HYPH|nr:DEAD/DEAH box helicase [Kaustia mangrovi]QPC42741.1 DEAD/DEAH box helicase [Kaustia mangrovi]
MSFKKKKPGSAAPSTPVGLLPLLTRRTIPDAMSHQKDMLAVYAEDMVDQPDVAMQLPTGSGKTLVGLFIAEWRRRKFKDRVVYLCPTRQLVNQTVAQAEKQYGIDAVGFTGSHRDYAPGDVSDYTTGAKIAVTTYSSLFNASPFFNNPDTILLDDTHAAENYIAKMWSLEIPSADGPLSSLHAALAGVVKPYISGQSYARLTGDWEDRFDATWVDKLPTETVTKLAPQLIAALDAHKDASKDVRFTWPLLRDHLHACHIYLASREILIRPLVPPTWTHAPFHNAKQRIYMSATLGAGGDLERLTGRAKIARIEAPEDFRKAGVGRRFFIFPGLSLEPDACEKLRKRMQKYAGRSVVLTPNAVAAEAIAEQFDNEDDFEIFSADDIETSKEEFIKSKKAAAIMAGRFDGIDFPNDECRLLCLDGLPKATNAQDRFLMSKMGASALLNERTQTRVLQAAGRCTRALQDRSAVFVTGHELLDYLADDRNWRHFHPELQAELDFGVYQSKGVSPTDFMEAFKSFFDNDASWDEANGEIVSDADTKVQHPYPAMNELEAVVRHEVAYQRALWSQDFERALEEARAITSKLTAPELKGYRALWHYLAGSVSQMLSKSADDGADKAAREQFIAAKDSAPSVPWLAQLTRGETSITSTGDTPSEEVTVQVERLENVLLALGTASEHKFEKRVKAILDNLADPKTFEEGQRQLGDLLGFVTGNGKGDAAPDPWWLGSAMGIVFEDHADGKASTVFSATKAKQAATHPDWLQENEPEADNLDMVAVVVTPCTTAGHGAKPTLKKVRYWSLDDFRSWSKETITIIRTLKISLPPNGDLFWRMNAADTLSSRGRTLETILDTLPVAADAMTIQSK